MIRKLSALLAIVSLGACQHQVQSVPAVLLDGSDETLSHLKAELATALDRARVDLGSGDLTQTSVFAIAPPPLGPNETRSTALPERYQLEIEGGRCFAVSESSEVRIELQTVRCRAL